MDQLRVAMIGAGFMGRAHSLALPLSRTADDLGARLEPAVLVEADAGLAERFADQFGWPGWSTDWTEVVTREDIDVVDICTPPQLHGEIALAAIAAGKHVFCEKPISNDPAQAVEMARAARAAGVVTQVGFNYRHAPAVGFARELLTEAGVGRPVQVRGHYLQDTGFGADPDRWRAAKATGGSGTVGDIGSHLIDLAEMMCGDVVAVSARMRSRSGDGTGWRPEDDRVDRDLVDDAAVWLAEFAGGAIGSFAVSSFSSGSKNRIELGVDATAGAVDFCWNDREALQVSYVGDPADHSGFRTIRTSSLHPDGAWRLAGLGTGYLDVSAVQFQKFARAISGTGPGGPDFADAAHVQQVVASIDQAARSDRWVQVPSREEL